MRSHRLLASSILAASLALTAPARADEGPSRRLTVTVESGVVLPDDHLHPTGEVGLPQPFYLGLTLDWALVPRLHAEADVGASIILGWMAGAALRYTALERDSFVVSAGAGPMVTPDAPYGAGVFAKGDLCAQMRLRSGLVVMVDAGMAWSLSRDGHESCGVDTCGAYLQRGDRIANILASVGYAFAL